MTVPLESLFSYGTLQYDTVQLSTVSRLLDSTPDILLGYRLDKIKITDLEVIATSGEDIHSIIVFTGNLNDQVHGVVLKITSKELQNTDAYEVSDYHRVKAQLASGASAWVYANAYHYVYP